MYKADIIILFTKEKNKEPREVKWLHQRHTALEPKPIQDLLFPLELGTIPRLVFLHLDFGSLNIDTYPKPSFDSKGGLYSFLTHLLLLWSFPSSLHVPLHLEYSSMFQLEEILSGADMCWVLTVCQTLHHALHLFPIWSGSKHIFSPNY